MIPDDCVLTVADGVVAVVGNAGDVRDEYDETGVYANDHQYLREFAVHATDRDAPTAGWERIARRAGPDGVTTILASGAPGEGRGDSRPLLAEKRVVLDDQVRISTTLTNYSADERIVDAELTARSSFRHIFECSGFFSARDPVDRPLAVSADPSGATLSATSPDGTTRSVAVVLEDASSVTTAETGDTEVEAMASTAVVIPPGDSVELTASASFEPSRPGTAPAMNPSVMLRPHASLFDDAANTLDALSLPEGVPAAGAPRFVAPFGRDALLVGFQTLPFAPWVTRQALEYFAAEQGTTRERATLEDPGKIFHESRRGDLPAVGESVRSPYYGTVDATPLFAALVAAYDRWAGPEAVDDTLYEAAVAAAEWVCETGDADGFLRYDAHDHEYGLTHLGWKDSSRAIAHPDGTAATGPIALAEVQGYAYRALADGATLAAKRGDDDRATRFDERAKDLRRRFDERFWLPDESCYALALDADGVVPSVASNQGHALWSGIVPDARADDVIDRLLEPDVLGHAGLRTFASSHDAFDPLSYHRGSIWPHDTAITILGFARYDRDDAVSTVSQRLLDALEKSTTTDPERWGFPELMLGLETEAVDAGRVRHPDACEPAAWSAGSPFAVAQAILGLDVRNGEPAVRPVSDDWFDSVRATVYCRGTAFAVRHSAGSSVVTPTATDDAHTRSPETNRYGGNLE